MDLKKKERKRGFDRERKRNKKNIMKKRFE